MSTRFSEQLGLPLFVSIAGVLDMPIVVSRIEKTQSRRYNDGVRIYFEVERGTADLDAGQPYQTVTFSKGFGATILSVLERRGVNALDLDPPSRITLTKKEGVLVLTDEE